MKGAIVIAKGKRNGDAVRKRVGIVVRKKAALLWDKGEYGEKERMGDHCTELVLFGEHPPVEEEGLIAVKNSSLTFT